MSRFDVTLAAKRKAAVMAALNHLGRPAFAPEIYDAYRCIPEAPEMEYKQVNALLWAMASKGLLSTRKETSPDGRHTTNYEPFNGKARINTQSERKAEKKDDGVRLCFAELSLTLDEAHSVYLALHKVFGRKR